MLNIKFEALIDGFTENQSNDLYFLGTFSSKVDTIKDHNRPNLDLSLIIDRSGSMDGTPLNHVKSAVSHFVDQLKQTDKLSIIQYDHEVKIVTKIYPNLYRTGLNISNASSGSTDILNGWEKGFYQFLKGNNDTALRRIMLFSDGLANRGAIHPDSFTRHIREATKLGISTSTYGIGYDFNEELMSSIAETGGGRSVYGKTANDLLNPMLEELDLLKSLVARDLNLKFIPTKGVSFEIMNQYQTDRSGGFNIPSVAAGGETWVLVKVKLNNSEKQNIRNGELKLFDISFKFFDIIEEREKTIKQTISVKLMSENEHAEVEENKAVRNRLNEILISYEQERAYVAMNRNDWHAVNESLNKIDDLSMSDPWLRASASVLKDHYEERNSKAFEGGTL